jgi:crotonobetainyl-CoA:carnitine CoA-transferase CaiB-like acyl-CoA transferase
MLSDVLVVEMASLFPGPFAGTILRSFGARVVKVEAPAGSKGADMLRAAPKDPQPAAIAKEKVFSVLNEGKESVVLDVFAEADRQCLLRFLSQATVFLFGFRPSMLDQFGLSRAALRAKFPSLIVCYLSGYGVDGPLAHRGGHDINYLARAGVLGMMSLQGPSVAPLPTQVADIAGGTYPAVMNILAGLHYLRTSASSVGVDGRPGRGCVIDASMCHASHSTLILSQAFAFSVPVPLPIDGGQFMLCGAAPCYRLYRTKDNKYMAVGALEPKFWARVVEALQLPASYAKQRVQMGLLSESENQQVLDRIVAVFATKTQADWTVVFDAVDCCVDPVLDPAAASASLLLRHNLTSRSTGEDGGGAAVFIPRPPVMVVGVDRPDGAPPAEVRLGNAQHLASASKL